MHALPPWCNRAGAWSKDRIVVSQALRCCHREKKIKGERTTKSIPQGSVRSSRGIHPAREAHNSTGTSLVVDATYLVTGILVHHRTVQTLHCLIPLRWFLAPLSWISTKYGWHYRVHGIGRCRIQHFPGYDDQRQAIADIPMATLNTTTGSLSVKR